LGDKHRFAVEVGGWDSPELRRVDLWAADQWLTCDDNVAYVPQFRGAVRETAVWVRSGHVPFVGLSPSVTHRRLVAVTVDDEEEYELRRQFQIFDRWGPTTDNLLTFLFRDGDHLVITLQFWRERYLLERPEHVGTVFAVEIQAAEFAGILEDLVAILDHGRACP
jgi:hypothetical protein